MASRILSRFRARDDSDDATLQDTPLSRTPTPTRTPPSPSQSQNQNQNADLSKKDSQSQSPTQTQSQSEEGPADPLPGDLVIPETSPECLMPDKESGLAGNGTGAIAAEDFPEGGRGWWVVAGCSMIAAVTFGFQLVWGVFQEYYQNTMFPDASPAILGFLGSIACGFMFPISVVCGKLGDRYGYKRFVITGCIISFAGMLCAAFCTELWQLFITQGVMPAIGWGIVLPFVMSYPSQWFKRLRGLATGLVIAGGSLGGAIASLIIRAMITVLGFRKTLLIYAFVHGAVMTLGCLLIKSRAIPGAPKTPRKIVWFDMHILRNPLFWSAAMGMMCTCFGYPPPLYFMSEYALYRTPSLSPQSLAVPIAVNNFASAIGRTLVGRLADRIGVINAFVLSVSMSALSQLLIWQFVGDYGGVMAFAVVFGFFGGCFISLAAPMAASLFGVHNLATLSGMLLFFNLPGNTAGAPIFGAILRTGNGENWRGAIIFSGIIQICGVLSICYARFTKQPRLFAVA